MAADRTGGLGPTRIFFVSMSVKADIERLVQLQAQRLELRRIADGLAEIDRHRQRLDAEVEKARRHVTASEEELAANQQEGRKLELVLKTAEDKVGKYRDRLLEVKTNKELWALQEEIGGAEREVDRAEEKIIRQLDRADELEEAIGVRKKELEETMRRADVERSAADQEASRLEERRQAARAAIETLRQQLPDALCDKFDQIETMRGGIAVAEARDETCMACNYRLRPQLYVGLRNLAEVLQCDNCKRILYVRDTLDLPEALLGRAGAEPAAGETSAAASTTGGERRRSGGDAAEAPVPGSS